MDKFEATYWQMVWFFSMEDAAQEALLGTTEEQWFIDENKKNPGANYLIGLCTAFLLTSASSNRAGHMVQICGIRSEK